MSDVLRNPSYLRLVRNGDPTDEPSIHEVAAKRRAEITVQNENRAAAANPDLKHNDPRWVLAARAYSQLQGSALTADRRERVLKTANTLGIRPFDANLIIAIVQDQARRGRPFSDAHATISMVEPPQLNAAIGTNQSTDRDCGPRISPGTVIWWQWVLALAAGLTGTALLIRWVLGSA